MNQIDDRRGLATTVASRAALDCYETALSQMLSYTGDPVETIETAISEDPEFVMGHCLRAHADGIMADAAFNGHVRESVLAAEALASTASDRERRHVAAARSWLEGRFSRASDLLESVLIDYPTDTLALPVSHLFDFCRGNSHNLRDRVSRVLPNYSRDNPEYGYARMYAFGLEECNEYARAEEIGTEAVGMNAGDVWAIHAVAHVLEMQGRQDDGIDWYESRLDDWSVDNGFSVHNWWHLALYCLDIEKTGKVLEIYDSAISGGSVALEMLDESALLWRLLLADVDTENRWSPLCEKWENTLDGADITA